MARRRVPRKRATCFESPAGRVVALDTDVCAVMPYTGKRLVFNYRTKVTDCEHMRQQPTLVVHAE